MPAAVPTWLKPGHREAPFTGLVRVAVLGPPLTAGCPSGTISPSPVYGASRCPGFSPPLTPGPCPMSRNYYGEIHLHMIWHTKDSLPLLTPQLEPVVHRY